MCFSKKLCVTLNYGQVLCAYESGFLMPNYTIFTAKPILCGISGSACSLN